MPRASGDYRAMLRHQVAIGTPLTLEQQREVMAELDRLQALLDALGEALWLGLHNDDDAATLLALTVRLAPDTTWPLL